MTTSLSNQSLSQAQFFIFPQMPVHPFPLGYQAPQQLVNPSFPLSPRPLRLAPMPYKDELSLKIQNILNSIHAFKRMGVPFNFSNYAVRRYQQIIEYELPTKKFESCFVESDFLKLIFAQIQKINDQIAADPANPGSVHPSFRSLIQKYREIESSLLQPVWWGFCLQNNLSKDSIDIIIENDSVYGDSIQFLELMNYAHLMWEANGSMTPEEKNEIFQALCQIPYPKRKAVIQEVRAIIPQLYAAEQRVELLAAFKKLTVEEIPFVGYVLNRLYPTLSCPKALKLLSTRLFWQNFIFPESKVEDKVLRNAKFTRIVYIAALICHQKTWFNSSSQVIDILDSLLSISPYNEEVLAKIEALYQLPAIVQFMERFQKGSERIAILKALTRLALTEAAEVLEIGYKIESAYRSTPNFPINGLRLSQFISTWSSMLDHQVDQQTPVLRDKLNKELRKVTLNLLDCCKQKTTEGLNKYNPVLLLRLFMNLPPEKRFDSLSNVLDVLKKSPPSTILGLQPHI